MTRHSALLFLFLLVFVNQGFAQVLSCFDVSTLQPIENAKVFVEGNTKIILATDGRGQVDLSELELSGPIIIQHPYYKVAKHSYNELRQMQFQLSLVEKVNDLDEVVVSASRFEEKKADVVQKIQVLRASELRDMNQTSMADVLQQSGGVQVQKSQQGGGSPIIRGFETNRILLVVDGVRMNNAIYRGGHLQNVITLDNATMDRVELVYGPGSVVYGSDALGGVLHFYTKTPSFSANDTVLVKSNQYARYYSAANGYAAHADVSVANQRLGSLTSFTYSEFNDLRQGANRSSRYPDFGKRPWYVERINGQDVQISNPNPNIQVGSDYKQYDFLQKIVLKGELADQTLNIQYSTSSDVQRYDRLTQVRDGDPRFAEWYYGPQERLFMSYRIDLPSESRLFDDARIVSGYQQIEESRITRRFQNPEKNHRIENLDIFTFNIDFEKETKRSEIRYGAEAYANFVNSTAFTQNIESGQTGLLDTRYPDGGSQMTGVAAYFTQSWELGKRKRIILSDGLRFSQVNLKAKFIDKSFFPFPFSLVDQQNEALNGHLGAIFKINAKNRISANVSTGFRAPNIDDLAKVFESSAELVVLPNPRLRPEYAYNAELGYSHTFFEKLTTSATGFATLLNNALSVQRSTFNGSDSILYEGQFSPVATVTNNSQAYILGYELGVQGDLSEHLALTGNLAYTYGRLETPDTLMPMDHIPPLFGKVALSYKRAKLRASTFVQFAGWKRVEDYNMLGEDNFPNATADGMPSWYTLNARVNYQFTEWIGLQVACENILDYNYRVFASNISAPGRNFVLTLRTSF